jgi:hypothetical protein
VQSGFYFDFFLKKVGEIFLKNVFIYSALFFGEKYIIEVLTKKIIDNYIFFNNSNLYLSSLSHYNFFNITIFIIFYFVFVLLTSFLIF